MPTVHSKPRRRSHLATALRRLPSKQRDAILAVAAAKAEKEYSTNSELTAFDAFGEGDLYGRSSDSARASR